MKDNLQAYEDGVAKFGKLLSDLEESLVKEFGEKVLNYSTVTEANILVDKKRLKRLKGTRTIIEAGIKLIEEIIEFDKRKG